MHFKTGSYKNSKSNMPIEYPKQLELSNLKSMHQLPIIATVNTHSEKATYTLSTA